MQLARPALVLASLGTLVVYSIMLYFFPAPYHRLQKLQSDICNDYATVVLREGAFNNLAEVITIYVRERSPDGELRKTTTSRGSRIM